MTNQKLPTNNPDPITGAPGAHPVGTGIGAASGGAAGAAIGAVAGPPGIVAGTAIGAIVGGLAGKATAEAVDPTVEALYWREQYPLEPYYASTRTFEDYAPAYRTGYEGYSKYYGHSYDDVEASLERDYKVNRGDSSIGWNDAKLATRAAWHRLERALPGDADRDGH
ncbi:hypothetical protein [Arenimonas sp.]|uniref:hypothetical protein n=1 Tax=Arenimonas sp. TaxID=1872635 RepID=UPI0039E596FF